MATRESITQAIFEVIDEFNAQWPDDEPLAKSPGTVLFGPGGRLDSLGLIHFMVSAEQKIEDTFGAAIALADENAMSPELSPFRTVATLIDHVDCLLETVPSE